MSIQVTDIWWSGLIRAVAVLGVLVGVFAMHGLTGNHDVTMVSPQMTAGSSVSEDVAADVTKMLVDRANSPATATVPLSEAASMAFAAALVTVISVDEHQHGMAGACLAMLTSLVLWLVLTLALRSLLAWRPVRLQTAAERPLLTGRSPPWLAPSLSKLCVLRT
jgi:hypothetical protein